MKLWFENAFGDMRIIAECKDWNEVYKKIDEFIQQNNEKKEHKFISYYKREWFDTLTNKTKIDVGSWSEFFYVSE